MPRIFHFFCFALFSVFWCSPTLAVKIVLKDGRIIEGRHTNLSRVDEKADEVGKKPIKLITVIDDGLRYNYTAKNNIAQVLDESSITLETFLTKLEHSKDGKRLDVLGEFDNRTRFDSYGRRLLPIRHGGGIEYFTQAMTELNPRYVRVRAHHMGTMPVVWDMRLATNSLPRDMVTPILMNRIDPKNLEDRIRLVRFYYGGYLYEAADEELDSIMQDWENDREVKQKLAPMYLNIRQQKYDRRLKELDLRWRAGQYQSVRHWLDVLDKDENLPDQLFEAVRRMIQRYDDFDKKKIDLITRLKELYEKLPAEEKDERLPPILEEITTGLTLGTIERLATFQLYANDSKLTESEKLAVAVTGWFAGSNADNRRLSIAKILPETRSLMLEYLQTDEFEANRRQGILEKLKTLESARPDLIARMLAYLRPPKTELSKPDEDRPGFYRLEVDCPLPGQAEKIRYIVQLPPEYDPDRGQRYPVIVTLNGLTQTPETQIDWWAGPWRGRERSGHATRNGYIVVAPDWNPSEIRQLDYDFSAFPHAAVLYSLKDVFRRFNVDTDRVFLSGHGIGGTAAWDIALAHPDLWAGAIPFNAVASKYISAYHAVERRNSSAVQHVPLYLIWGELEGIGNVAKWGINAPTLNRCLGVQHNPPDVTVVRFIGRGVENFSDEILNLFDWMKLRQRNFTPMEFEASTMRAWDYFFWWVELYDMEKERPEYMTDPLEWPVNQTPKNMINVRSKMLKATNTLQITVAPKLSNVLVYLSPDVIDFTARTKVQVNNKDYQPVNGFVEPDVAVILEDARTRSDRLHPFWAVLDGKNRNPKTKR